VSEEKVVSILKSFSVQSILSQWKQQVTLIRCEMHTGFLWKHYGKRQLERTRLKL